MPKPEIARRCAYCGASIRVPAIFCAQCGQAVTPKPEAASETTDAEAVTPDLETPELTADTSKSTVSKPLNSGKTVASPTDLSTSPSTPRKQPLQATVRMVDRPGPPPREMIEGDGRNRVEKFRQISNAVIDEAAYDPSLRFVLVAALLFVFFIFLLLLSELIT
jgi:hypothetical protein